MRDSFTNAIRCFEAIKARANDNELYHRREMENGLPRETEEWWINRIDAEGCREEAKVADRALEIICGLETEWLLLDGLE